MDGEAGWWTRSGNIGLPSLARVMGVGRQQQHDISKWEECECYEEEAQPYRKTDYKPIIYIYIYIISYIYKQQLLNQLTELGDMRKTSLDQLKSYLITRLIKLEF